MKIVAWIYLALGLAACALVPLNLWGLAGEPDPLSGVFALLFALPWSLVLKFSDGSSTWTSLAVCLAGIAANFLILMRLARGNHQKSAGGHEQ